MSSIMNMAAQAQELAAAEADCAARSRLPRALADLLHTLLAGPDTFCSEAVRVAAALEKLDQLVKVMLPDPRLVPLFSDIQRGVLRLLVSTSTADYGAVDAKAMGLRPVLVRVSPGGQGEALHSFITGVAAFAVGRYEFLEEVAVLLNGGVELPLEAKKLVTFVRDGITAVKTAAKMAAGAETEQPEISKAGDSQDLVYRKLFIAFDVDGGNTLSLKEFRNLLRHMPGMQVSHSRAIQVFSRCDAANKGALDAGEFVKAMKLLEQSVSEDALARSGLSQGKILAAFASVSATLLALFAFIFLGIQAFTTGSSFGAVINSMIPLASGAGLGSGGTDDGESNDKVLEATKGQLG